MAESSSPGEVELKFKPVQELVISGDEISERYIYKDGVYGKIDVSPPVMDIPVIDMSYLAPDGEEVRKLQSALCSWGCFQAVNHGMTSSFLDEVHDVGKKFFALSMEEKQKYSRPVDDYKGYGNDMVLSEHQIIDWNDRLYLLAYPEDQRKLKHWPKTPGNFRETLHEYTMKLRQIIEYIFKAMAWSLSLEENCFLDQCGERALMQARFNFYPRCPTPDLVLGLKPHADGSIITILLQDKEVEGLEFLKDDNWFKVPITPHALFINVGDQMEIMSNGIFKSPVHRAVANLERERMTFAMFCSPQRGNEIGPVEKLIDGNRPRLYKNVKNYVDAYFQHYQHGKRPIDALKV